LAVEGTDEAYVKGVEEETKKLKAAGFPSSRLRIGILPNTSPFSAIIQRRKPLTSSKLHGKDQVLWPPHWRPKTLPEQRSYWTRNYLQPQ